jgi:hypothetical protein
MATSAAIPEAVILWLTMPSDSSALPRNGRSEQNEQTIERALIFCFTLVVAANVFWVLGGSIQHLWQQILSQLHASLIQVQ